MAIHLKKNEQVEKMYRAGQIVREVLDRLGEMVAVGVTTEELDVEAERICTARGADCLFKGVPGRGKADPFPGNICASINEEVVHGIPSPRRVLEDGDIVSVDFGVQLNGWCADAARTYCVGTVPRDARNLVEATKHCLDLAVERMRPGEKWSSIARSMQDYARSRGFSVVEEFVGHGIGREMHEDPKVPNFVSAELRRRDIVLKPGLVIAVEPMVNLGAKGVRVLGDGWTIVTADGKCSAHWEHTLAVIDNGVRVLTG
ncbi:MAG: type I methionyl aminopeptidase [Phycisphaerae bacterium]|nr:type I methionyl aminopeptidase [Phycisphaerae bacterium]